MSNHDDFWTTFATGHSNTVLAGAMDSHLSGKSIGETFGSVRNLTDRHREANALALPVGAGTKVVFAGGLGAHMSYDDVPADGTTGEVVTVKSATGEITHHGTKVFVKWADGKFRPIHAEHLRLASEKPVKTADQTTKTSRNQTPKLPAGLEKSTQREWAALQRVVKGRTDYRKFTAAYDAFEIKSREDWGTDQKAMNAVKAVLDWVKAEFERKSGNDWRTGRPLKKASDIKAQFEKIKALAEKRPDSDFLKSILKQMADKGFAPTDKQMAVVKKIEGEIKQQGEMKKELKGLDKKGEFNAEDIGKKQNGPLTTDPEDKDIKDIMDHFGQGELHEMTDVAQDKTAMFRVASLGDLTDFLKVASGALVHKSTKDLWSYSKDADGNFLVSRLFDGEGEPLKV